jgi:hypothetical protein
VKTGDFEKKYIQDVYVQYSIKKNVVSYYFVVLLDGKMQIIDGDYYISENDYKKYFADKVISSKQAIHPKDVKIPEYDNKGVNAYKGD